MLSLSGSGPELCHVYLNAPILMGTFDGLISGELTFHEEL